VAATVQLGFHSYFFLQAVLQHIANLTLHTLSQLPFSNWWCQISGRAYDLQKSYSV